MQIFICESRTLLSDRPKNYKIQITSKEQYLENNTYSYEIEKIVCFYNNKNDNNYILIFNQMNNINLSKDYNLFIQIKNKNTKNPLWIKIIAEEENNYIISNLSTKKIWKVAKESFSYKF